MVKKIWKPIVIGIFLLSPVSCIDLALGPPRQPPFKIASTSPESMHSIIIERRQQEPSQENSWITWKVFLSFTNYGQQVLKEVEVGAGG